MLVAQLINDYVADKEWEANYNALVDFHAEHGTCPVLFGKKTGSWTKRKKNYEALKEDDGGDAGSTRSLPSEKKTGSRRSRNARRWNARRKRYEAVKAYGRDASDLRVWMECQRKLHALSRLEPDKVDKLTELGFAF